MPACQGGRKTSRKAALRDLHGPAFQAADGLALAGIMAEPGDDLVAGGEIVPCAERAMVSAIREQRNGSSLNASSLRPRRGSRIGSTTSVKIWCTPMARASRAAVA